MPLESPGTEAAPAIADLWEELAREQRQYGSHLLADANRDRILETVVRALVTDSVRVVRSGSDDEIVGFVTFSVDTGHLETSVDRGTIENIYVKPSYRSRGLGSELLEAAQESLAERGVETVTLEVMAENEAARRFYGSHGYEPHRIGMARPVESDNHSKDRG